MKSVVIAVFALSLSLQPAFADEPKDKQVESVKATAAIEVLAVERLSDIKKIFVAPLGTVMGAELIRQKLINCLINAGAITIVDSPDEADAILNGAAELHPSYTTACYSAELVVRLTGMHKRLLWTDEATFVGRLIPAGASKASSNVVDQVIKDLTAAIEMNKPK